jgi:hypothetical protein
MQRLLKNELTPREVITKDPKKLASELKKRERNEALLSSMQKHRTDWTVE